MPFLRLRISFETFIHNLSYVLNGWLYYIRDAPSSLFFYNHPLSYNSNYTHCSWALCRWLFFNYRPSVAGYITSSWKRFYFIFTVYVFWKHLRDFCSFSIFRWKHTPCSIFTHNVNKIKCINLTCLNIRNDKTQLMKRTSSLITSLYVVYF